MTPAHVGDRPTPAVTFPHYHQQVSSSILAAFVAGLLATPHCLGMCGGFAAACSRRRAGAWPWHLGRAFTYTMLGALAGAAGATLRGPAWIAPAVSIALLTWFAASLAGLLPAPGPRLPLLTRAASRAGRGEGVAWRVAFGAATGLLPCGMVYAALALAISTRSASVGALTMLAFAAGTAPGLAMMAVAVQRFAAQGLWRRRVLALLVLATGLWSIGMRTRSQGAQGAQDPHGAHSMRGHSPVIHGATIQHETRPPASAIAD